MPLINVEFDNSQISDTEIKELGEAIRDIVSHATGISDVFVYGNSALVKIQVAPIEIFIKISKNKINDIDVLTEDIQKRLIEWKKNTNFKYPINMTLVPMDWKVVIGI